MSFIFVLLLLLFSTSCSHDDVGMTYTGAEDRPAADTSPDKESPDPAPREQDLGFSLDTSYVETDMSPWCREKFNRECRNLRRLALRGNLEYDVYLYLCKGKGKERFLCVTY